MKVYLINLDKDTERLKAATDQLSQMEVPFERISAVYAKEFSVEKQRSYINQWRWSLAVGRHWRPGEIGCALSHFAIYQRMIAENIPVACVLEDDILLSGNLRDRLEKLADWVDAQKPQVVLLSCHSRPQIAEEKNELAKTDMFTEAYVITKVAAQAILKENYPLKTPCDHWGRWVKLGIIKLYHSFPTIADQNWTGYASNIGQSGVKPPIRPLFERIVRHCGFLIDGILLKMEVLWQRCR